MPVLKAYIAPGKRPRLAKCVQLWVGKEIVKKAVVEEEARAAEAEV